MEFHLPELGEGVYEAELSRWLVEPGAVVKAGQGLLEVLTDKATMEVPAPFAGTIGPLLVQEGQTLKVGQAVLSYEGTTADAGKAVAVKEKKATAKPPAREANGAGVKAAPSVRLMARKLGVELAQVRGSGPAGRVLIDDLMEHVRGSKADAKPQAADAYGTPGTRVKFQGVRRKIAEHMVESMHAAAPYTYVDECDVSDLVKLRESLKEPFARRGVRLTYLAFFVKAVALALKEIPIVNASLDDKAGEIVLHDHVHIGIAVATPNGLVVPVVKDADCMRLEEIARSIDKFTNDVRSAKVRPEDLRGGTFTITSIGNIGGLFATPILHRPQLGILGVGKIVKRPVFDDAGALKSADMVYLSMTFDHRVLDGAVGAAFGNAVMRELKNPGRLLIGEPEEPRKK